MRLIPTQYQELETIYQAILEKQSRCIAFSSLVGGEGNTSVAMSVAKRLSNGFHSVLYLDLNLCNPTRNGEYKSVTEAQNPWGFSDISCQLSPLEIGGIEFLSAIQLRDDDSSRDIEIANEAFIRLQQEYEYIIIDLSPLTRKNQANIPLHILTQSVDLFMLTVALGESQEADLLDAQYQVQKLGFKQLQILVCQHTMPALGPKLLCSIEKRLRRIPWLKNKLCRWVKSQPWLYHCH